VIRVTLNDNRRSRLYSSRPAALKAPEPLPPKVKAFWDYDENVRRTRAPWRYAESPAEQSAREEMERGGAWTG
jgi:hypothetical protein